MRQKLAKPALAASVLVLSSMLSFGWSRQSGPSVSVEKAEARVGRPLTPVSVAGVARRQYRRTAVGTAAAVGAAGAYYAGGDHHGPAVRAARAAYYGDGASAAGVSEGPHYAVRAYYAGGPWYGYSGWDDYAGRNGIKCMPGGTVKLDDGLMYYCQ